MAKKFSMPVYYVIYFEELFPCYLIQEGYIPCRDYRENVDDDYYCASVREDFCIASSSDKKNIFTNKKETITALRNEIETNFNKNLRYLIEDRTKKLKTLEN